MPRDRDEPVRLTRIYTRGGDSGETSLGDGARVPKTDPRIEAYGAVDELNSALGWALVAAPPGELREWLELVQNELFDLGADLSVPPGGERERLRVSPGQVERLERWCDHANERLEPLRSFVLPGGGARAPPPPRPRPRSPRPPSPPGGAPRSGGGGGGGAARPPPASTSRAPSAGAPSAARSRSPGPRRRARPRSPT